MAKNAGIELNSDYDLSIRVGKDGNGMITGGLLVGDTLAQNQALILICQKGEWKDNPTLGVGLGDLCADNDFRLWKREITRQLEADGQRLGRLVLNENEFILEANYK
jgi:hypothetical protein